MKLAVAFVALILTCNAHTQPAESQKQANPPDTSDRIERIDDRIAPQLKVEPGCSETELRMPVATVTWRSANAPDVRHRIDIAAQKQGFAKGQFIKVNLGPRPAVEKGVGLSSAEKSLGRTLDIRVDRSEYDERRGVARVDFERLEPGVVYFFRVARKSNTGWDSSRTQRLEVPPCVADIVEDRQ